MSIVAYHVSTEQDLRVVNTNVCDDPRRDGHLYGANVASFTTTLYKGRLPDFSPYPRSYEATDDGGYRYQTTFNPRHFNKFLMATSNGQVHFLLLDRRRPSERVVAKFVRAFLRAMNGERYDEAGTWATYFPRGRANDYADSDRVFVNVMFWHDVPVERADVGGSHQVEKRGPVVNGTPIADNLGWFERLLELLPDEESEDENDNDDDDVDELAQGMRRTRIRE